MSTQGPYYTFSYSFRGFLLHQNDSGATRRQSILPFEDSFPCRYNLSFRIGHGGCYPKFLQLVFLQRLQDAANCRRTPMVGTWGRFCIPTYNWEVQINGKVQKAPTHLFVELQVQLWRKVATDRLASTRPVTVLEKMNHPKWIGTQVLGWISRQTRGQAFALKRWSLLDCH